jgi:hopanoid biosynthesis associated protein HpnK
MAGCRLIVHADDFGLSRKVNEGIVKAHLDGIVTSTSIMSNGTAFEHAIKLCRSVDGLDIGIHLTLVEQNPVLEEHFVPSLLDRSGQPYDHARTFVMKYLAGKIRLTEIERELDAQINKVMSYGLPITHLDGHQHIHMLPKIRRIVSRLAQQYKIPAVRFPCERLQLYMLWGGEAISRLPPLLVLNALCRSAKHVSVQRTDHFVGFFFGGRLNREHIRTVIEHLPHSGTCELMCHPGYADPASPYRTWGYCWSDELEALLAPDVAELLRRRNVQLISYRELISGNAGQGMTLRQ